jgi:hypothetical protein
MLLHMSLSMLLHMSLSMLLHMSLSMLLHMSPRPLFAPGEKGELPRSEQLKRWEQLKMSVPQLSSKAPQLN